MASVLLFPNVATHRKLPHLQRDKEPNPSMAGKPTQSQVKPSLDHHPTLQGKQHHHAHQVLGIPAPDPSRNSQDAIEASPSSMGHNLLQSNRSSTQSDRTLFIDTHWKGPLPHSPSTATGSTLDTPRTGEAKRGHSSSQENEVARGTSGVEGTHLRHPLNSPHGHLHRHVRGPSHGSSTANTPQSALPPSGVTSLTSSSLSSAAQESKLIKTALYDAFGCLYHPAQHTHCPTSASSSTSHTKQGALTVSHLRSGEVTPLAVISPRPSPMLRPHLGPSAPITPLELSEESGGGYFGLQVASSSASSSRVTTPVGPGLSMRYGHSHLHQSHCHHHHQHSHLHPRQAAQPPSHLSPGHLKHDHLDTAYSHQSCSSSPNTLSRKTSLDFQLDPTEHPVLCSLQTLSLTHPHPANHYHPHLGHDLGHDRVSIAPPTLTLPAKSSRAPAEPSHLGPVVSTRGPLQDVGVVAPEARPTAVTLLQGSGLVAVLEAPLQTNTLSNTLSSSLFPMNAGDGDSIAPFGGDQRVL